MEKRIQALCEKTMNQEMGYQRIPTEYDRADLLLRPIQMSAKRVSEYILNQEPLLTKYQAFTGCFLFDGSVEGDRFTCSGAKNTNAMNHEFYLKPYKNLMTVDWQHSVGDFGKVIRLGLTGILEQIDDSLQKHEKQEEIDFLEGLRTVVHTMHAWAQKCSQRALELAQTVEEPEYKANLLKLSDTLKYIPMKPAQTFYEAVLCLYICFPYIPDSIGTIDRYFEPFYRRDMANGTLTQQQAASYLQELFLMLQAWSTGKMQFTRGGESHFCVGGYRADGTDSYTDFTQLVLDSLLELPTFIPQVSLRWTPKMKFEDFKYVLTRAVQDPNMRVAFVNDVPRIKGFIEIVGIPYEDAVGYSMCGCNEPALIGGSIMGSGNSNIARFLMQTFYDRREEILACQTFEEFYQIAAEEMEKDLGEIIEMDTGFNLVRARDVNLVSSIFFRGCIENARSISQGGCDYTSALLDLIGFTTVVDSMSIVKQFVFDEKRCTMEELTRALDADWEGYEDLHTLIHNKGRFFGNNDPLSDEMAVRLYDTMYNYLKDKTDWQGKHYMVGDLIGYWEHNQWFGAAMKATPDGRRAGDRISFGRGQSEGRDRNGLTALLNSAAGCDPHCLVCGPTVTNLMLDEQMVKNPEHFDKLALLLNTYFENGGMHFQLTYTDRETLLDAKAAPERHESLRVRVSGFSDFFNRLDDNLQNEIIDHTNINA